MPQSEREDGFYWVRYSKGGDWEIFQKDGKLWWAMGSEDSFTEKNFAEIGARITRDGK